MQVFAEIFSSKLWQTVAVVLLVRFPFSSEEEIFLRPRRVNSWPNPASPFLGMKATPVAEAPDGGEEGKKCATSQLSLAPTDGRRRQRLFCRRLMLSYSTN